MSLQSRVSKTAERFDIFTGVPWQHVFPEGSNVDTLTETGVPTTRQILAFHLRRALLSACHEVIQRWGDSSSSRSHKLLSRLLNRIIGKFQDVDHYDVVPAKVEDLVDLKTAKGPHHVATSLSLSLPDASSDEPVNQQALKAATEQLIDEAADIITWVALSKSVQRLTIYEKTGILRAVNEDHLKNVIDQRLKSVGYPTRRVALAFAGEHRLIRDGEIAIVFASDVLGGKSCQQKFGVITPSAVAQNLLGSEELPDLFIAFDNQSNGFPLAALSNALVFTPEKTQAVSGSKPLLRDYIEALEAYDKEARSPVQATE